MILVSTMDFSDMPDIMVLQETILDIALWVKLYIDIIFRQNGRKSIILVSTIGFSGMPDIVVWLESTLAIALWVKSKMAAICKNQNLI